MGTWTQKETEELRRRFSGVEKLSPYAEATTRKQARGLPKWGGKIDRVIQLIHTGMNDTQIAKEVELSKERVRQIRKKHCPDIESPLKNKWCAPVSEEKLSELIRLAEAETQWDDMTKALGLSQDAIKRILKNHGIERKKPKYRKDVKYTKEFLTELYLECDGNISEMARKLGKTVPGITRACSKYGIKGKGQTTSQYRKELIAKHEAVEYMHKSGMPITEACKKVGITNTSHYAYRRREGIVNTQHRP